ncbi:MAG: hypothetical protein ACXWV0_01150 [Flavisolibacter sp.]
MTIKKIGAIALISVVLFACKEGSSTRSQMDSINKKVDSTAENTWDSGKNKLRDLKDEIRNQVAGKDSVIH